MSTSYSERDYCFGQAILTLRTAIGLTQAGLARMLRVSRRAVGEWESGGSYLKAEHLKQLIALGVRQHAFPTGREIEEIRHLWKTAHQKVLLDEHWLSTLLDYRDSPFPHVVSPPIEETLTCVAVGGQESRTVPTSSGPRLDWSDAPTVPVFYGREEELALLSKWVVQEHCRVVGVLGMGGIGKSTLSVNLMYQLAFPFDVVIFRSLRDVPSCEALLADCLQVLSPQPSNVVPSGHAQGTVPTERLISLLLEHLRKRRVFMVLDNLESLVQEGDTREQLRPGFEGYGQLLHRVAETAHQSCLLFTSREKPAELRSLEGKRSPVRSLRLAGLDIAACRQLLEEKEVVGSQQEQEQLSKFYGGNPLALKMVAETIVGLFGGEISPFLANGVLVFGGIADLLDKQFARLSALEQSILRQLAIAREPMTLDELLEGLVPSPPRARVLEAVDAGHRRSLIECGKRPGSFTLQAIMQEYMITVCQCKPAHHYILSCKAG